MCKVNDVTSSQNTAWRRSISLAAPRPRPGPAGGSAPGRCGNTRATWAPPTRWPSPSSGTTPPPSSGEDQGKYSLMMLLMFLPRGVLDGNLGNPRNPSQHENTRTSTRVTTAQYTNHSIPADHLTNQIVNIASSTKKMFTILHSFLYNRNFRHHWLEPILRRMQNTPVAA